MIPQYILNVFFNSFFTFYMTFFLVFLFIKCFRIKNPRVQYLALLLPFLKVVWDLCLFSHPSWIFHHGETVFNQPLNSRIFSAYLFFNGLPGCGFHLLLKNDLFFSFGDILYEWLGHFWTFILAIALVFSSLFFACKKMTHLFALHFWINNLKHNSPLYAQLNKIDIFESTAPISSPFAAGIVKPKIFLPKQLLETLSKEEVTAIITHEISHIKCFFKR